MFQSVNNTAKFDCLFALNHVERAQFSVYCRNSAAPWDATQLTTKANQIRDAIVDDYMPVVSEAHDFVGIVARDLEDQFGRVEEVIEVAPIPGGLAQPTLPGNVAVVATFKSALGAPRRGRIFLLPPTETQVVGDLLSLAAQAALFTAADSIHDAVTASGFNSHVIVSRFQGNTLQLNSRGETVRKPTQRVIPAVADVAAVEVKRRTDSMRSRLSKEPA